MRKESIKFIGDLAWFSSKRTKGKYSSPRQALTDHIRYITRPEECVLKHNLSLEDWGRRADSLLAKNARSRIASKVVFALPNSLSPSEGAQLLREFLTKETIFRTVKTKTVTDETGKKKRIRERIPVKLSSDDFGFAIHEGKQGINKQRNLHAHVVFSSTKDGKKLDINRKELSELHRKWEEFLREKGYHLRKSPIRNEPHYGPQRLRFDSRARASYQHLSRAKQYWREAVEEEKLHRMLESITQTQGSDLLTWSEIQEDEEGKVATREGKKSQESPPPRPSRPVKPVRSVKPVTKPKPVRSVQQQPKVSVLSQRPSQSVEEPVEDKNPLRKIQKEIQKELAQKKKREQEIARQIDYETKKQARTLANSPPPRHGESYSEKKERMEVGNVINPYVTQEVVEERQEVQRKIEIYQAEMTITYRFRYLQGKLTFRFRTLSSWTPEQRKGMAAFLASVAVAVLYGYEFPRESLLYYGEFVYREAVSVREQVKKSIKKPFYSDSREALKALSVKRVVHVRVRIFEGGKLIEEHNFFLTRESFTVFEKYAEAVRRRRRPPEPSGQEQGQPPQPGQPEPPVYRDEDEDYEPPEPGM